MSGRTLRLMHAKLHRFRVTDAHKDYVGSVTIDADLLDAVGMLPLEEVEIVNIENGERWSTYVLPGPRGSGCICPNGGGAALCKPGDVLILFSYVLMDRETLLRDGHAARVAVGNDDNSVKMQFEQVLAPAAGEVSFDICKGVAPVPADVLKGPAFEGPRGVSLHPGVAS